MRQKRSLQLSGDVVIRNPVAGATIQIRNYDTAAALTVIPLPGLV